MSLEPIEALGFYNLKNFDAELIRQALVNA